MPNSPFRYYDPTRLRNGSRANRSEFAIGLPKMPRMPTAKTGGVMGSAGRGLNRVTGAIKSSRAGQFVKKRVGMVTRTRIGKSVGAGLARTASAIGGVGAAKRVGKAFQSARKFRGSSQLTQFRRFR